MAFATDYSTGSGVSLTDIIYSVIGRESPIPHEILRRITKYEAGLITHHGFHHKKT